MTARTRFKLRLQLQSAQPSNDEEVQMPSTKNENWRDKLKKNPEEYERQKLGDRLYSMNYRDNMSEEKKAKYREQTRLRMKKYRERKKANKTSQVITEKKKSKGKVPKTRSKVAEDTARKEKERLKKRALRAQPGYKERENAKRREKRRMERQELLDLRRMRVEQLEKEKKEKEELERSRQEHQEAIERQIEDDEQITRREMTQNELESEEKRKKQARRQSVSRAKKALPRTPNRFQRTLVDLCKSTSTPVRKAIRQVLKDGSDDVHQVIGKRLAMDIKSLKKSRKKADLEKKRSVLQNFGYLKKYGLQRKACRVLGITAKALKQKPPQRSRKSLTQDTVNTVKNFYQSEALVLPDKRFISKKTLIPTGFLQRSITSLYSKFREVHPTLKVGLKKFFSLRPAHIKPMSAMRVRGCLCEYCTNVELKIQAINGARQALPKHFQNVYDVSALTMCSKDSSFHKKDCIQRKCKECGTDQLKNLLSDMPIDRPIKWKKWEKVQGDDEKKKMSLVRKEGTIEECIKQFIEEVEPLPLHLFNAAWQHHQYKGILNDLKDGEVLMVMDFAENYTCLHQDEVQGAHWNHEMATVHPIVCFYCCPKCKKVMQESVVFISEDLTHDYTAVDFFFNQTIAYLRTLVPIDKVYRFSDGASVQYKCKDAFVGLVESSKRFPDIDIEHHFFGSRHGKGPSDGESAVIKKKASMAVMAGEAIIANAKDLAMYATNFLQKTPSNDDSCLHFRRKVEYVTKINREGRHSQYSIKAIKGTRKLHAIKPSLTNGHIMIRDWTCNCQSCLRNEGMCQNANYVSPWEERFLFKELIATVDVTNITLEDTSVPTVTEDAGINEDKIDTNKFVAVKFEIKKDLVWVYLAMVTKRNLESVQLKFMRKVNEGYIFSNEAEATHPFSDIVSVLCEPMFRSQGRSFIYSFNQEELARLNNDYIMK